MCTILCVVAAGNDVNSIGNEDLTRTTLKNINHDEEEKFKFIPHHKPFFKKPVFKIPPKVVVPLKPFPAVGKPIPVNDEKPLPIPGFKKPFLKPFPFEKKPFPKPFIPKPIPFVEKPFPKPLPKPIPFEKKPFLKPFIPKPIPVDDEKPLPIPGFKKPFLKPFPFEKKPFPKPFFKKPFPFPKKPFFPPVNNP